MMCFFMHSEFDRWGNKYLRVNEYLRQLASTLSTAWYTHGIQEQDAVRGIVGDGGQERERVWGVKNTLIGEEEERRT